MKVHHTVQSKIPLGSLFNIRAFSSDSTSLPLLTSTSASNTHPHEDHPAHDHDHDHDQDQEDERGDENEGKPHYNDIKTIMIPLPTLSTAQHGKTERFLESILWDQRLPPQEGAAREGTHETTATDQTEEGEEREKKEKLEILRTKGYLKIQDGREYVIQGVTDIFEMREITNRNSDSMDGKLVFIGRGVGPELKDAFNSYVGI